MQTQHTGEIYVSGHGALQWCRERSGAAKSRQGLALLEVLSCREGDVSAYCTWGRRAVLFPLPTCATVSGIMNQSCSFCVKHFANYAWQPWSACPVGAYGEASPAVVLLRQEHGAALVVLAVDLHVTLVSLSNQSWRTRVIFWLCSGEPFCEGALWFSFPLFHILSSAATSSVLGLEPLHF